MTKAPHTRDKAPVRNRAQLGAPHRVAELGTIGAPLGRSPTDVCLCIVGCIPAEGIHDQRCTCGRCER